MEPCQAESAAGVILSGRLHPQDGRRSVRSRGIAVNSGVPADRIERVADQVLATLGDNRSGRH